MLNGKQITLIIGGGIAAYKALELIRRLREKGVKVRGILTAAGAEFVTPLSVASLTEEKCYTDLFSLTDEAEMGHIRLSREADLLVVAPATADLMAKMAHGQANDLASTVLLATDKSVLVAPAMNGEMWAHKATQRNIKTLKKDGISFSGPAEGLMACGETGFGRMSEVADMVADVEAFFEKKLEMSSKEAASPKKASLKGKRVLVTAGPTHEAIDPVRYIANRSSGKQGYAIASALGALGADVTLVSGPTDLPDPSGIKTVRVTTALEMLEASEKTLPVDVAIMVAAVADWRMDGAVSHKLKKLEKGASVINFTENPDILASIAGLEGERRPALVVGFAAETENIIDFATEKRARKGCDWIVANDVGSATGVMGGDHNEVHLITVDGVDHWEKASKRAVANKIAASVARHFEA